MVAIIIIIIIIMIILFGCDMILLIKHMVDWELLRHQKQTQINKDNIRKNGN